VDNAYSDDPDDAVSIEGNILYVHVADPASAVLPGSPVDKEARNRGATLYLPEGPSRMIAGEALALYALGLGPVSPALTFKLVLAEDGALTEADVFPSLVRVTRLSYAQADSIAGNAEEGARTEGPDSPDIRADLSALMRLADRNFERRQAAGAVNINFPDVHISLSGGKVVIEPDISYRSAAMIRECMLLAGEGAARWAAGRALAERLAFPYVCQETEELPGKIPPDPAGSYQLRRCMRPRTLSVRPARHEGLGLEAYTQVTSPLRRYTDLLAHQQIRAALGAGVYRDLRPQGEDELALVLAAGEAAAAASVQAERASRAHWTAVYLSDKKGSQWDGIALEKKGNRWVVLIPALGLETQISLKRDPAPNDPVGLVLTGVKIPEGEAVFTENV
jgi:exoribonuclease-2